MINVFNIQIVNIVKHINYSKYLTNCVKIKINVIINILHATLNSKIYILYRKKFVILILYLYRVL